MFFSLNLLPIGAGFLRPLLAVFVLGGAEFSFTNGFCSTSISSSSNWRALPALRAVDFLSSGDGEQL